jgi:hypothetical protein
VARFWDTNRGCPIIVCREVDGPACSLLADLFETPVIPGGLLAPYDAATRRTGF